MLVHVSKLPNLTVEGRRPQITACGSSLTVNVWRRNETMRVPADNETWVIEAGDVVIQKKARSGSGSLAPWERLVYCLWVADYGMRNAGDLDTAHAVCADFQSNARRIAKDLSLRLTHEASSLPRGALQAEYFIRFDYICHEIRNAEPGGPAYGRSTATCPVAKSSSSRSGSRPAA